MENAMNNKTAAAALMMFTAIVAVACASAIGAITTLVVMPADQPATAATVLAGGATVTGPAKAKEAIARPLRAPNGKHCAVVVWNTGMIYCVDNNFNDGNRPGRNGLAVVAQAVGD